MKSKKIFLLLLIVGTSAYSQSVPDTSSGVEFAGLTHQQLTTKIFEGERTMIASLQDKKPWLETYLQSLWPYTKTQSPIDDAYFLS